MQEVSKENDNHCVSGGFIFDQMDRFAHDQMVRAHKVAGYLFTFNATIWYYKQVCNWDLVELVMYEFKVRATTDQEGKTTRYFYTTVKLRDKETQKDLATGTFDFIEKDRAYCDTKEE